MPPVWESGDGAKQRCDSLKTYSITYIAVQHIEILSMVITLYGEVSGDSRPQFWVYSSNTTLQQTRQSSEIEMKERRKLFSFAN